MIYKFRLGVISIFMLMTSTIIQAQQYTYDTFNRLTSVTYSDGSEITYTYDKLGNRIGYEVTAVKVFLDVKLLLAGPYNPGNGLMNDGIRSRGNLPLSEPFTAAGYQHQGAQGGGEEVLDASVFADYGGNSVVDWVVVELRDKRDVTNVLHTRAALLQRDGDVVDVDGTGLVGFFGVGADDYYVAIKHRNHLGVATANPITVSSSATTFPVDFTSGAQTVFGADIRQTGNATTLVLPAGDVNGDGIIRYADLFVPPFTFIASDALAIFTALNGSDQVNGYSNQDVNMDGVVRYSDLFIPPFTFIPSDALSVFNTLGGNPAGQINQQY